MLSGTLPFPGRNDDEKEDKILRAAQTGISMNSKHWANISKEGKDFVKALLNSNPAKRLSGKKALSHPWITNRAQLSDAPLSSEVALSLKKYADANRFEKAIRHQMATHLTTDELHRLRNVFEKLDTDGTGNVSIDVLMKALQEDAADAKTAETLASINLSHFDLDGDGQIDWQEFVAGCMHEHEIYNEDNLEKVFSAADKDGNGTLCHTEVAALLGDDHEFSREVLDEVKKARPSVTPGEVHLTLAEFKQMMLKGQTGSPGSAAVTADRRRRHQDNPVARSAAVDKV